MMVLAESAQKKGGGFCVLKPRRPRELQHPDQLLLGTTFEED